MWWVYNKNDVNGGQFQSDITLITICLSIVMENITKFVGFVYSNL